MEAQLQIRQNALEAQDYMRDLLNWQASLKQKQGAPASGAAADRAAPAVRGRAAGAAAVPAPPAALQQPALAPGGGSGGGGGAAGDGAAHTYKNYGKWDAFDVDAALRDEEPGGAQRPPPPPQLPAPRAPPARAAVAAGGASGDAGGAPPSPASLKERGNRLYQAGYFADAAECYSRSLAAAPSAAAFANRAAARLKLGQPAEAEADCSAALALDGGYVKALHRRGTARRALGRHLDAAADFEAALRLEPANKVLHADRDAALTDELAGRGLQPGGGAWGPIAVRAEAPEPEAGGGEPSSRRPAAQQAQSPAPQPARPPARASSPAPASAAAAAAPSALRPASPCAAGGATPSPRSAAPSPTAAAAAAAAQLAARLAAGLKPPATSNEFEAAWRSLRGDAALQARYLGLLQPAALPALFKSTLTAPVLVGILTAALGAVAAAAGAPQPQPQPGALAPEAAVALVAALPGVPRFGMAAMCIGRADKDALRALWDGAAAAAGPGLQAQLAAARPKFRL
ncbi:RPAP3 [Scenedesmus sp. PABB004]|nr:RPAP3 [Scenedesmus sp. PABB004]